MSDFAIMGGDWNISLSQELDISGYISENNKNAKKSLLNCREGLGLVDIFRYQHPNKKKYSWRQFGGIKRARLDFLLVSSALVPFVANTDIEPGIESDHSIPVLDVEFARFQRGRGFFKFNNSLLKDKEYVELISEVIRDITTQYVEEGYNGVDLKAATPEQLQDVPLNINPQLFLKCHLLEIRG